MIPFLRPSRLLEDDEILTEPKSPGTIREQPGTTGNNQRTIREQSGNNQDTAAVGLEQDRPPQAITDDAAIRFECETRKTTYHV
jgi:hypothetical protein